MTVREKFIDKDDDAWDSLEKAKMENPAYNHSDIERYVHEDDCIEKDNQSSILKYLPLFGYYADENGQIWVKSPFNVRGLDNA